MCNSYICHESRNEPDQWVLRGARKGQVGDPGLNHAFSILIENKSGARLF